MVECFYKFTDLFRVAQFVVTDRAEPVVRCSGCRGRDVETVEAYIGAAR